MVLDDFARYVIAARQMDPLVERKPDSKESGIETKYIVKNDRNNVTSDFAYFSAMIHVVLAMKMHTRRFRKISKVFGYIMNMAFGFSHLHILCNICV